MNHKRKRPASRRAGCKMCKYWKKNGCWKPSHRDVRTTRARRRRPLEARLPD